MHKLYKFLTVIFSLILVTSLASCSSKPSGSIVEVVEMRDSIKITVLFQDENSKVNSGSLYATIVKAEDETQVGMQNFDAKVIDKNQEKTFTGLSKLTDYIVYLYASYDGKKHQLDTVECSTTNRGIADEPIEVTTFDEFVSIKKDESAYYVLKNDIDAEGQTLAPLFTSSVPFKGSLNGNGYTVSNFKITSSSQYQGVFGALAQGSKVENINFNDIEITSSRASDTFIGAIAGLNNGTINNVKLDNIKITASSVGTGIQYIGGVVGKNDNYSTITNTHATNVKIIANTRNRGIVGGFIGENSEATKYSARQVVNTNSVIADITVNQNNTNTATDKLLIENTVGGFVGLAKASITNCYADSTITVTSKKETKLNKTYFARIGGFAGTLNAASGISNCAVKTNINYTSTDIYEYEVGGIIGYVGYEAVVKDCVILAQNSSITISDISDEIDRITYADMTIALFNCPEANISNVGVTTNMDITINEILVPSTNDIITNFDSYSEFVQKFILE